MVDIDRRIDIDILRAIAVLLVVAYHYFPSYVKFGYLGVDIFIVISGYLMVASYNSSDGPLDFLKKRAYRLLPALIVVALLSFVFINIFLRKDLLYDFNKEILASLMGLSNFYYWTKIGYFDSGSLNKIFLMSWSLSLEFQYYILITITYALFIRKKFLILVLIFFSMGSNYFFSDATSFYILMQRLWEFLSGALLYHYRDNKNNWHEYKILIPYFFLILIISIKSGVVEQLISVSLTLVFISNLISFNSFNSYISEIFIRIGKASYSIYLIHWPVLFIVRSFSIETSFINVTGILLLVFYLSAISYKYVEIKLSVFLQRKRALCYLYIPCLFLIAIVTINERRIIIDKTLFKKVASVCNYKNILEVDEALNSHCKQFGDGSRKKILLWGDSHADRIVRPIVNGSTTDESLYVISHNGCPPLLDFFKNNNVIDYNQPCGGEVFAQKVVDFINLQKIDTVVLVSRWPYYFNGYDGLGIGHEFNGSNVGGLFLGGILNKTIDGINADKIIVVIPPFELIKKINLSPAYLHKEQYFRPVESKYIDSVNYIKQISDFKKNVKVFDMSKLFCESGVCKFSDEYNHYYHDDNHLSDHGADYIYIHIKTHL